MKIFMMTELLPPQFHWSPTSPTRGTEKFYVKTAEALVEMGHDVRVFNQAITKSLHNGVVYGDYVSHHNDLVILCNPMFQIPVGWFPKCRMILWTNFVLPNYKEWLSRTVGNRPVEVVAISDYARSLMGEIENVSVVGHGVDRNVYHPPTNDQARERVVAFTSSPDRGLNELRSMWIRDDVEAKTGFKLWTGTYGDSRTSDVQIAERLRTATFWIHPGIGNELFCLAAAEAQACEACPIVVTSGALGETVRTGHRFANIESFQRDLTRVLTDPVPFVSAEHIQSWKSVTEKLIQIRT